jgi:nucleoside-diphosphate-sugar epimerase
MSIFLTGSSGFVGKSILSNFSNQFELTKYTRGANFNIKEEIVIHCAGKAHDLKNTSDTNEYYSVNTELTKNLYDAFLSSDAKVFISLSSVKAVADKLETELTEDYIPNPITHYGKSKLLAEQYILNKEMPQGKRVFILRPCMIHGHGNKGNLNLLYKIVSKGFPWPLGLFENKRSFCSIDNLCFIISEIIKNENIPSGVYNIADDEPISTNDLIKLIANSQDTKYRIWNIHPFLIKSISILGDFLKLPLNTERLNKLTETFIVSNKKIIKAINKPLPLTAEDGLMKTLNSFKTYAK